MTTALVFAGTSFIGRAICDTLHRRGVRVVATARRSPVCCDLTDPAAVDSLLERERPDWVIQCAGATDTNDPWQLCAVHVNGTLAVLSAVARHVPAARVLLFGSAAEYGPVAPEHLPIRESHPAEPATLFGASKLAQTQLAAALARQHRLCLATLRPFNVLGRGLPEHYFAAALASRLLRMRREQLPGPFPVANLHATRDFIDVRDLADAVAGLLARSAWQPGEPQLFNVASGEETTLADVATELGRLAGGFVPVEGGVQESRGGAWRSRGDATRLRRAIGWAPRYGWRDSLAALWAERAA